MGLITKIFGTYSSRELKRIKPIVDKTLALRDKYEKMSDEEESFGVLPFFVKLLEKSEKHKKIFRYHKTTRKKEVVL